MYMIWRGLDRLKLMIPPIWSCSLDHFSVSTKVHVEVASLTVSQLCWAFKEWRSLKEERSAVYVVIEVLTYTFNLFLEALPLLLGSAELHHGLHLLLYVPKVSLSPVGLMFLLHCLGPWVCWFITVRDKQPLLLTTPLLIPPAEIILFHLQLSFRLYAEWMFLTPV